MNLKNNNLLIVLAFCLQALFVRQTNAQYDYFKELEIVKGQLQKLGYRQMPIPMQANLLSELKYGEVKTDMPNTLFVEFGDATKYLTLSKNRFFEINNTQWEISNKQKEMEKRIDPVYFALSIDPLAEKFPSVSPYNSMGNNPINRIDLTGMADVAVTDANPLNNTEKYVNIVVQDQGVVDTHKDKLGLGSNGKPNTLDGYTSTFLGLPFDQLLKVQLDKNYQPLRGNYETIRESILTSQKTLGVVFIHAESIQGETVENIVNALLLGQKTDEHSMLFISSCFFANKKAAEELALRTGLPVVAAYGGVNHTKSITKEKKELMPEKIFSGGEGWVVIVPDGNGGVNSFNLPRGWYTLEDFQSKVEELRKMQQESESSATQAEDATEEKNP